jgi:vacuolar-type H+-ATPase subunit I/STV1
MYVLQVRELETQIASAKKQSFVQQPAGNDDNAGGGGGRVSKKGAGKDGITTTTTTNDNKSTDAAWAEALALAREEADSLLVELTSLENERQKALATIKQLRVVNLAQGASDEKNASSGGKSKNQALSPKRALALAASISAGGISTITSGVRKGERRVVEVLENNATNEGSLQREGGEAGARNGEDGAAAGAAPLSEDERAELIAQTTQEVRGIAEEELAMADDVIAELRAQLAELQGELANTKAELTARLATPSDLPAKLTRQESMEREAASLTLQVLNSLLLFW